MATRWKLKERANLSLFVKLQGYMQHLHFMYSTFVLPCDAAWQTGSEKSQILKLKLSNCTLKAFKIKLLPCQVMCLQKA